MDNNLAGFKKASKTECVHNYNDLDDEAKELIKAANWVRQYAYVPYSNFKVGAAFRTKEGRIYSGCNVENAAFSPSICAERNAICKAVSDGFKEFTAGAVVACQEKVLTPPCGVCRQTIMEFAKEDVIIYVTKATDYVEQLTELNGPVLCTSIYNLLPYAFCNYQENDCETVVDEVYNVYR
uniref:Cytidine deaminase n=1 Tax=Glossina brevipalpis TaxID=37001 RepID=A0A1A9W1J1_9MUSC